MKSREEEKKRWSMLFSRYRYVLLVAMVGALLLLWPGGKGGSSAAEVVVKSSQEEFDLSEIERKLSAALSQVEGAGEVNVVLTVRSTARQVVARDDRMTANERTASTVVVSKGSGTQEPVLLEQIYPEFQGALVVCTGGGDAAVRLKLVEAVSALTGLGADKISICRGK